jgi:catalase
VTTPQQALDAVNDIFGPFPSCRPGHVKGTICSGWFTPTPEAAELTQAPHMQGAPTEVTVRFSNNAGDPYRPDGDKQPRGMATRFHLEGDSQMDIVAITLSRFASRTPDDFVAMNRFLSRSGGPFKKALNRARLVSFVMRHPESVRTSLESKPLAPRIPSYANCRYNALHSFKWVDAGGRERYVRYSWIPEDGERCLRSARGLDPDFLQQQLRARLAGPAARPVRFQLQLQLASVEDLIANRIIDPTKVWPDRQEQIVTAGAGDRRNRLVYAGLLELDSLWNGKPSGKGLAPFSPVPEVDGIEPSDDPVLRFRPGVYELSFRIRTGRK